MDVPEGLEPPLAHPARASAAATAEAAIGRTFLLFIRIKSFKNWAHRARKSLVWGRDVTGDPALRLCSADGEFTRRRTAGTVSPIAASGDSRAEVRRRDGGGTVRHWRRKGARRSQGDAGCGHGILCGTVTRAGALSCGGCITVGSGLFQRGSMAGVSSMAEVSGGC